MTKEGTVRNDVVTEVVDLTDTGRDVGMVVAVRAEWAASVMLWLGGEVFVTVLG